MITPKYNEKGVTIYHGECVEVMRSMPDNSVDSIVTDPPYGIRFMGKAWDGADIEKQTATRRKYKTDAPGAGPQGGHNSAAAAAGKYDRKLSAKQAFAEWTRVWCVEALRILKPGGHMLVFCGPRTYHRMASGVEDAGFEIRDQIMWLYGSGFPKSLDVSKAIDKRGGAQVAWFGPWFRSWREENGITQKEVAKLFLSKTGGLTGCVANWELGLNMPTPEQFNAIRDKFDLSFDSIEEAEREVTGQKKSGIANKDEGSRHTMGASKSVEVNITAPATPEAKQWDGWGTALKPAHEPICVARKPLIGTVGENVLKHGTGGINIDGGRISGPPWKWGTQTDLTGSGYGTKRPSDGDIHAKDVESNPKGRFPANLILDPEAGAMLDKQSGELHGAGFAQPPQEKYNKEYDGLTVWGDGQPCGARIGDSGGASRFFYCAKASKQDRDEGLEGMPLGEPPASARSKPAEGRENALGRPRANHHPTVKPTDLMQYLCRLVTPPGGTVLDPFMGSGSTGKAAVREGFKFIGCEREAEYIPISIARINAPAQVELL